MALTPEQLAQVLNRSRQLCNENGDKLVNKHVGKSQMATDVDPNTFSDEWDNFRLSESEDKPYVPNINAYSPNAFQNSNMPKEILESMQSNPINVGEDASLSNALSMVQPSPKKQQITEMSSQKSIPVQQYGSTSAGIDYTIIKAIVKECISDYFSKQPLNESASLKQIGLSEGKIKLVDNKGNIFTAQLEFDGNIKDRKKTK